MRAWLANQLASLALWLHPRHKAIPAALTGSQWTGGSAIDVTHHNRTPTPQEMLQELKNIAWTCASINAAACASAPPSLYVITQHHQPRPRCAVRPLARSVQERLRSRPHLLHRTKSAATIEEVTDHPLLALFSRPNPYLGSFDLWELTTLYQEVHGSAYWYLEPDPVLDVPAQIWLLPTQNLRPRRGPQSPRMVDYYEYRNGRQTEVFPAEQVIHFRYPDPRDPYASGLSPLRACIEQVLTHSEYTAFKLARLQNRAIPDAIISPEEVMGEEERDRIETQWNQRFRRSGAGKVVVGESGLRVQLLNASLGDVAALAESKATKEDIANAFHVPIAFLTSNTNLANLLASRSQHAELAIAPRLERRDELLNAHLLPLFDPTGRLFLDSDNPTPVDSQTTLQQQEIDLKYGVVSINEYRSGRGLPPVSWGHLPWLNTRWAQTDVPRNGTEAHTHEEP